MCGCVTQNCNCGAPAPMPTCNVIAICLTVIIGIVFVGLFVLAIINEIKNKNHCRELEAKQKYDSEVLLLAAKCSCLGNKPSCEGDKPNCAPVCPCCTVEYTREYLKSLRKTTENTTLLINCKDKSANSGSSGASQGGSSNLKDSSNRKKGGKQGGTKQSDN